MKIRSYSVNAVVLRIAIVFLTVWSGDLPANEYPDLFDPVQFQNNEMTARATIDLLKPDISAPEEIKAILPGAEVILKRNKIEVREASNYTWVGVVNKHHQSMAVLTVVDGILSGYINLRGLGYTIEYKDSLYVISKKMSEFILPLANDSIPVDAQWLLTNQDLSKRAVVEDGSVIDVMVLYTKQFQAKFGRDPKEVIQNYIDISNEVFVNSRIQTRFNLVHFECLVDDEVQEDRDIKSALIHITTPLTEAQKKRDRYKADLVTLLREYMGSNICGRAWTMSPPLVSAEFKSYGFSVVEVGQSCSQFTFVHELAHNMGCADDKKSSPNSIGAFDYSHGYQVPGIFATVMSYYQPKIPYFSNPDIPYQGYVIGVKGEADNAQTINQTKTTVANFMIRDSIEPQPIEIIVTPSSLTVPEGSSADLNVRLSAQPASTVHISIWRSSGDLDITVINSLLIFNVSNWNIDQKVTISALPDADTIHSQATIRLSGIGLAVKEITAVEKDIGIPPEMIISRNTLDVPDGGTASFTVKLSSEPSQTISVTLSKSYGDADIGIQSGASLTFTQLNWYTPQEVVIAAIKDSDTVNGSAIFKITSPGLVQKEIEVIEIDNDQTLSFICPETITVPECGQVSFNVTLSSQPPGTVTASVSWTQGDSDISVQSGSTLTFSETDWNSPKTVTLKAACDSDAIAGAAQFQISASGVTPKYISATEKEYTPPTIVTDKTNVFVNENGTGTFQVKLSSKPYAGITISVSRKSGDSDIVILSGSSLLFTIYNWDTYQTVTLKALADGDAVAGTAIFELTGETLVPKEITAEEVEPVVIPEIILDKSVIPVSEGGTASLGVKFSRLISESIIVTASIISGDPDITITSGSVLSFTPLNWNTYQYVTVTASADLDDSEGEAAIQIAATGYSSKTARVVEVEKPKLVVQPATIVQPATPLKIKEGETSSFDVKLSAEPNDSVTVTISVSGDPDIRITTGSTLTFTKQNWNSFQTVGVSAVNDADSISSTATIQLSALNLNPLSVYISEIDKNTQAILKIGDYKVSKGTPISIPVVIENTQNVPIQGVDIEVKFSETVLKAVGITLSGSVLESSKYYAIINTKVDGQISVKLYAVVDDFFSGSGIISVLLFNVIGDSGQRTDLTIIREKTKLNEKSLNVQNGSIDILSNAVELSGKVTYFSENTPVRNVTMELTGNKPSSVITNENGNYHFSAVEPGNYILTPSKSDDLSGVTATDASRIMRLAFDEFNCYQRIAADVTRNGEIGATDASWVALYSSGIKSCINDDCIDWVFTSVPLGDCPDDSLITLSPNRQYSPLGSSRSDENFIAVRLGDVTGNWVPDSQLPVRSVPKDSGRTSSAIEPQENIIRIPLYLPQPTSIEGIDIVVSFDGSLLKAKEPDLSGGILDGKSYALNSNLFSEGKMTLTIYAMDTPYYGSGIIAYIVLEKKQNPSRSVSATTVSLSRFDMNETLYPGKFYINNLPVSELMITLQTFTLDKVIKILQILSGLPISVDMEGLDFSMDRRCGIEDAIGMLQAVASQR